MRSLIVPLVSHLALAVFVTAGMAGPIHDAARKGDIAAVERFLDQGAQIDEGDGEGKTALYLAVQFNFAAIVRLLLDRGADPNKLAVGPSGPTTGPIHAAVNRGNLEIVRALAQAGADLTIANVFAMAPLHLAIKGKKSEVTELLRSLGAADFQAPDVSHLIATASIDDGERLAKACNSCHAMSQEGEPTGGYGSVVGPTLWNIVGRPKAGVQGFRYSEAMSSQTGEWGYRELNNFIANPTATVPGTSKFFLIEDTERRAAIIAYLRTLTDQPAPLP